MTDEESQRFLVASKTTSQYHALFMLLLTTGLRPNEALALRWQDIDTAKHSLRVLRTVKRIKGLWIYEEPKTKRSRRVVDYPASLSATLLEHRVRQAKLCEPTELVFAKEDGEPLHEKNILTRHYRPLLKVAALSQTMRLYDLRHTHATLMLLAGVHPKVVSERLGHSSVSITLDTYSHVIPSM